jgi:hypothetical protein
MTQLRTCLKKGKAAILVISMFMCGCAPTYRGQGVVVDRAGAPISGADLTFDASTPSLWMGDGHGSGGASEHTEFHLLTNTDGMFFVVTKNSVVRLKQVAGFIRVDNHQWSMVNGLVQDSERIVVKKIDNEISK